ncbi:MAG: DUF4440 domain-containing protein [Rhodothermia bacterium]|nr:DUF4440 domain-containing protein [Rhodothermia bacterium]
MHKERESGAPGSTGQLKPRFVLAAAVLAGAVIALLLLSGCRQDSLSLTAADLEQIKRADRAYADAWLSNDSSAVMATLVTDPVIVPSGMPAFEGPEAIRDFWWPENAPLTTVHQFDLEQHEVGGDGEVGFVRGSFSLAFEYAGADFTNSGEYVSVLRRSDEGTWRISHRIWSDHPAVAGD